MVTGQESRVGLPVRHDLMFAYAASLIIAVLVTAASVAGLIYSTAIYPTNELFRAFVPNDVVSLCVGVPVLLISMMLTHRGKLFGLLCWPGALLFMLYNYTAYVFALPLSVVFLLHLTLVMLSVYTSIGLFAVINRNAVSKLLTGAVHERAAGAVLVGLGLLFLLRVVGVVFNALINTIVIAEAELAVSTSDFLIAPASVISGILLWQHKELGYVTGLALLFQTSMLFIALIVFLLVQPFLTAVPLAVADIVVVSVMSLICFIPFFLFAQGVLSKRSQPIT